MKFYRSYETNNSIIMKNFFVIMRKKLLHNYEKTKTTSILLENVLVLIRMIIS